MTSAPPLGRDLAAPFRAIAGALFLGLVALSALQIVARTLLSTPLTWTEELSRLLLVWMTFVAAGVLSYDDGHLKVETIVARFPPRVRRGVEIGTALLSLVFLAVVAWFSVPILRLSAFGASGALGLPLTAFRAPAPVGAVLMFAFTLLRLRSGRRRPVAGRQTTTGDDA